MSRPVEYEYVVIEGNIGSGKTTLSKLLAKRWGSRLMLEEFKDNPFLPKFYQNPQQHGFALELSFLAERYHQKRDELNKTDLFKPGIVCDYSFAKSLVFAKINLDEDEFGLYQNLFHIIHGRIAKPDLLIYLHCSANKSLRQIQQRGRQYEQEISIEYLEKINAGYLEFFKQQTGTRIILLNTEDLDFVKSEEHLQKVFTKIESTYSIGIQRIDPL